MISDKSVLQRWRFSTDDFPERERVTRWREEFGRSMVMVDVEPLPSDLPFRAEAVLQRLPGVRMALCSGSAARQDRTRAQAAESDGSVGLVVNFGSKAVVAQRDNEAMLGRGDAFPMATYEAGVLVSRNHLGVLIPRAPLASRVDDLDRIVMQPIRHDIEALNLLMTYLAVVKDSLELNAPALQQAVANHIHDLVALTLGANRDTREQGKNAVAAARLVAAIEYIGRHFTDPALTVAGVARQQGISPRYLQELLEQSGASFTVRVNELRLRRAFALLTRFPNRPVSEIAAQVGFSNVSHFNRLFRQRFGETPSGVRGGL